MYQQKKHSAALHNSNAHLYRCEYGCYIIDGTPLILQDVQADAPISIDCIFRNQQSTCMSGKG